MIVIKAKAAGIREYEKKLKKFRKKAFPFVVRSVLNDLAFATRARAQDIIRSEFTLRNRYTVNTILVSRVDKTQLNPDKMYSEVGAVKKLTGKGGHKTSKPSMFMRDQEFGSTQSKKGKHGIPIPTGDASGEPGTKNRRKLVQRRHYLKSIAVKKNALPQGNRYQRARATVNMARKQRRRFVFLNLGRRKGIFRIGLRESRKKIKGRIRKVNQLRMVWDLSHKMIRIRPIKWLDRAKNKGVKELPSVYAKALRYQLKRRRLVN